MKKHLNTIILATAVTALLGAPAFAGDGLANLQESGVFRVGIEGTYPPFTYHDEDNELVGFDVEVAKAVAEKLGVEVEFTEAGWDSLLAAVDAGRLDSVINDVSITDERKEAYEFTEPYGYLPRELVVLEDNEDIHSLDDLDGKATATNLTNAYIDQTEALGAKILPITTAEEAFSLLLSGRADFLLTGVTVVNSYLEANPDAPLKVVLAVPGQDEIIGIPVKKGETELRDAIDEALDALREDGTLGALSETYFGADYTNPTEELPAEEAATE